jgi:hypothetical protein
MGINLRRKLSTKAMLHRRCQIPTLVEDSDLDFVCMEPLGASPLPSKLSENPSLVPRLVKHGSHGTC